MTIIKEHQISTFRMQLIREEKSRQTIDKYIRDVRFFYDALGDDKVCTKEAVIKFKKVLMETYQLNSANSMLAGINHFMEFLGIPECKVKQFRLQKQIFRNESKELTKQEYFRLVKAARENGNERLCLILQTICATGIRISELKYFTVSGINEGRLHVYCKNKQRVVFIPEELRKKLRLYCAKHQIRRGQIFLTKFGNPLDRSNIWGEMKNLCEQARVASGKVFPHNLRHLFARSYYKREHDITKLADILGHCSVETTRIYIISTGREHRRQLEGLGLLM